MPALFAQRMADALQVLLLPLLAVLVAVFLYAVYELGRLAMAAWQRRGRRPGEAWQDLRCFTLLHWAACHPAASDGDWDIAARRLLAWPRLLIVAAPMLGLAAGLALAQDAAGASAAILQWPVGMPAVAPQGSPFAANALAPLAIGLLISVHMLVIATVRRGWLDEELAWLHARTAQQREREARLAAGVGGQPAGGGP
ncbi:hypothetical protein GSY71_04725 [Pusillimonas sp. TS35]|uniref:hypothetical protein n=1 Tax=Paracandidimonas lactea TaxID=2895524 RepID=UPI001371B9A6|nr:hypothetical protein [Paracandidimonas lactea]MYN12455.1 hypothetical protein [Pusillimonas sp. TS35]